LFASFTAPAMPLRLPTKEVSDHEAAPCLHCLLFWVLFKRSVTMLTGTFIGIDKYADGTIRELTGAARDATALWALVSDSLPSANVTLLANSDATTGRIRAALNEALTQAAPDDTVIVAFSGHGTNSHRLVTHDTSRKDLDGTTIGMDELAGIFKASKAKAILCVIDCCFSGAAPARVLEDSPISRDPAIPLEEIAGAGRILISACNVNEVAYESPADRHGLLTSAVVCPARCSGAYCE